MQEILENIKARRKEKGFTQADMAQKLGISQNAYKNIELGNVELKVKTLQQIGDILGIQLSIVSQNNSQTPAILDNNGKDNLQTVDLELLLGQSEIKRKLESIENDQKEIKSFLQKLFGKK